MKIAFIGLRMYPADFEGVSGIEVRAGEIINYFAKQKDNQVFVFVRNWANKQKIKEFRKAKIISSFTINNKYLDTLIYSFISSIYVVLLPIDIIFYEGTSSTFFSFIPKLFGKKIIITIHSLEWQRKKWSIFGKIFLKVSEIIGITFADWIIVVSQELEKYTKKQYKIKPIYIPYYLSFKKRVKAKTIQKKYHLYGQDYILYLGRFVPEKRIEWLIKIYLDLKPKQKLVLAGGTSHTDEYVKKLFILARGNKNIIFTGYVFGREKQELFSNCFLFALPSEVEGSSIATGEALSYKRPILVGDTLDYNIFISKKYLFKTKSFADFKDKLTTLIANRQPNLKIELRWKKFFLREVFFDKYEQIISYFEQN